MQRPSNKKVYDDFLNALHKLEIISVSRWHELYMLMFWKLDE